MKKMVVGGILILLLINSAFPACAQYGYSSGAYSEQGYKRSYFQRVSDWLATSGKTREEKALIKSQRRTARKMANNKKTIARKKKEIAKKKKQYMENLRIRKQNSKYKK